MTKQTIAIDFDGVIHKYSKGFQDGSIYDEPIEGVKEALKKLSKKFRIVIFTTRLNPCFDNEEKMNEDITNWLVKHEIYHDELTNNKPPAIAYIDDRGIRFTNWEDILKYFM